MVHRAIRLAMNKRHRRQDGERGAVLVMTLIFMTTMMGFAALVVDMGNGRQQRRQAAASADAAALAAAQKLVDFEEEFTGSPSQWAAIVDEAKLYTAKNFGFSSDDWEGCSDPEALAYHPDAGNSNTCISANLASWPAALVTETIQIHVQLPDLTLSNKFGPVIGQDTLTVAASATSGVTRTVENTTFFVQEEGGPCALCVLGGGTAFDGQNGDVTVTGGNVIVNSTASTPATLSPNGHVKVLANGKIGGPGYQGFSGSGYSPAPTNLAPVVDPLAGVPACGPGSTCPTAHGGSGSTLNPGVYSSISGSHTLNPGIYVLKGDITLNGNDLITGDGVMLYLACSSYPTPCSSGEEGARIKATGNGSMRIKPITASQCSSNADLCPYVGLSIFADRNNTATHTYRGNGTNENGILGGGAGTFYMKSGTLDLRGNGFTLSSLIVVNAFTMQGNPSGVTIAYDLNQNVQITHEEEYASTSTSYDAVGLLN
jgi:hypothetical protein